LGVGDLVHDERLYDLRDRVHTIKERKGLLRHDLAERIAESARAFLAIDTYQKGSRELDVLGDLAVIDLWKEDESMWLMQTAMKHVDRRVMGHDIGIGALKPKGSFGQRLDLDEGGAFGEG